MVLLEGGTVARVLDVVVDARALLGEGPCWDERKGLLYWIDGLGRKVHVFDPKTGQDRSCSLEHAVGCIVMREGGGALLSLDDGIYSFDTETFETRRLVNPEEGITGNRFNDGKADSRGRMWFGSMSLAANEGDGNVPASGSLYCMETDLGVRKVLGGVTISNGLGWSPDDRVMYYIDSPTRRVDAFDFDPESGTIRNRRTVVRISESGVMPDGMCVDGEGMLWVAQWGGSGVSRWNPATGAMIEFVRVPALNVTCCAFGGPDLDELYITTSTIGSDEGSGSSESRPGALYRTRPGVRGLPAHRFGGIGP
jgi:sugar lactone lactonase YvrE